MKEYLQSFCHPDICLFPLLQNRFVLHESGCKNAILCSRVSLKSHRQRCHASTAILHFPDHPEDPRIPIPDPYPPALHVSVLFAQFYFLRCSFSGSLCYCSLKKLPAFTNFRPSSGFSL